MTFDQIINLAAIIIGPIAAVAITLWIDGRRRKRDQQIQVLRMLLSTRHLAADPSYSTAINLIPVEFNDCKSIMNAWSEYCKHVRIQPTVDGAAMHHQDTLAKQTKLIYAIMRHMGFDLAETDIQTSAYAAEAFIDREKALVGGWLAWPKIADELHISNALQAHALGLPAAQQDQQEENNAQKN